MFHLFGIISIPLGKMTKQQYSSSILENHSLKKTP